MRNVYVLMFTRESGRFPQIVCVADRYERASMEMHKYTAAEQAEMTIVPRHLLEDGE